MDKQFQASQHEAAQRWCDHTKAIAAHALTQPVSVRSTDGVDALAAERNRRMQAALDCDPNSAKESFELYHVGMLDAVIAMKRSRASNAGFCDGANNNS